MPLFRRWFGWTYGLAPRHVLFVGAAATWWAVYYLTIVGTTPPPWLSVLTVVTSLTAFLAAFHTPFQELATIWLWVVVAAVGLSVATGGALWQYGGSSPAAPGDAAVLALDALFLMQTGFFAVPLVLAALDHLQGDGAGGSPEQRVLDEGEYAAFDDPRDGT